MFAPAFRNDPPVKAMIQPSEQFSKVRPSRSPLSPPSRRGFTLVELMIALAISGMVAAVFHQMTLSTGRSLFDSTNKLLISKDVRSFTNEISRSGRSARDFYLFDTSESMQTRQSGQSGDFLVLVWAEPESINEARANQLQRFFITRIVGYSREAEGDEQIGPVIRYERSYPLPDASGAGGIDSSQVSLPALIADMVDADDGATAVREVLQLSRGLANQRLFFFSSLGNSVIVNGEIYHGNDARRVTNTYNFTITPRG